MGGGSRCPGDVQGGGKGGPGRALFTGERRVIYIEVPWAVTLLRSCLLSADLPAGASEPADPAER